jgi:hypothetical protein
MPDRQDHVVPVLWKRVREESLNGRMPWLKAEGYRQSIWRVGAESDSLVACGWSSCSNACFVVFGGDTRGWVWRSSWLCDLTIAGPTRSLCFIGWMSVREKILPSQCHLVLGSRLFLTCLHLHLIPILLEPMLACIDLGRHDFLEMRPAAGERAAETLAVNWFVASVQDMARSAGWAHAAAFSLKPPLTTPSPLAVCLSTCTTLSCGVLIFSAKRHP